MEEDSSHLILWEKARVGGEVFLLLLHLAFDFFGSCRSREKAVLYSRIVLVPGPISPLINNYGTTINYLYN